MVILGVIGLLTLLTCLAGAHAGGSGTQSLPRRVSEIEVVELQRRLEARAQADTASQPRDSYEPGDPAYPDE